MEFHQTDEGWLTTEVSDRIVAEAQRIRAKRDEKYGNIYEERESDERWVGEVGEICFYKWLQQSEIDDFEWFLENAAGRPDFRVGLSDVGMKTVKRQVPFQTHYTAQVTAEHVEEEPVDHFFFASYEEPESKLWMIGGIEREEFRKNAQYYGAGEEVHPNYTIRPGHEIYNTESEQLYLPLSWIKNIVK